MFSNLSSEEIEVFLNHFNLSELNQIKNLLNIGYYNLGNIYNDIISICDKVEQNKTLNQSKSKISLKTKIEKLNDKELMFLNNIVDNASFSNIEEIDDYIDSENGEEYEKVFNNTSYVPCNDGRYLIETILFNELEKRKIKEK